MIKDLIKSKIKIFTKDCNWENAIEIASADLLEENFIKTSYVEKMIKNVKDLGPYICLTQGFAMPHARPEDGVNKLGMSLTLFKEDIVFPSNKKARLFITLAAIDSNSHLEAIQSLLEFLNSDLQNVLKCKTIDEIKTIIEKY